MFLIGLLRVVCSNGDIDLDWITSDTVTFFSYDIGINTIELININLMIMINAMILKLWFMLHLWLGVMNIKNVKHFENIEQRTNACNMASKKKVGFACARRRKERNKIIFDW